jgi:O-antigen/teichoic acid export membrane protein
MRPALAWWVLEGKVGYALGNHVASLLWNAPALVYPLMAINLLGARANAHFYVSWMVANLLFIVPSSVSTAAFARAANVGHLDEKPFWRTMQLTLAGLLLPALASTAAAPHVLRAFGDDYRAQGSRLLILLVLSAFPYTVNTAVITYHRIQRNVGRVVWVSGFITLFCLVLSTALSSRYALPGIGIGWLGGQVIGVAVALLSCRRAVQSIAPPPFPRAVNHSMGSPVHLRRRAK